MKKVLLIALLLPLFLDAQIFYPNGIIYDSTTFTFSNEDSLIHYLYIGTISPLSNPDTATISIDTSSTTLWQIGNTHKPVFLDDTNAVNGIMTDTLNPYPKNANDFFVLKVGYLVPNFIVDFWHKYQTDSLHAGCIVEFSTDTGLTWLNVAYCSMIDTQNFYTPTDTIISGQPAFTGNSHGEQLSRLQFANCIIIGEKTATNCYDISNLANSIYLRFRFVSDSTIDSLSGWIIDSIRIENPGCLHTPGYVSLISNQKTNTIFPNPAYDELNISSAYNITTITISNPLGQTVYSNHYNSPQVQVDVSALPAGLYFIKVNGADVQKFIKQ